jgi:hypothetical protein
MRTPHLRLVLCVLGLVLAMQGCAETSPQKMIAGGDHVLLVSFYTQEAKQLSDKAMMWESWAEFYEKHSESLEKDAAEHAAHCRAIAEGYRKAAKEAEALVKEHRVHAQMISR